MYPRAVMNITLLAQFLVGVACAMATPECGAAAAAKSGVSLLQLPRPRVEKTVSFVSEAALPEIRISGRQLLVDGVPLHLKGVNWNPVAKGGVHPWNLDFPSFVDRDVKLMRDAGINAVRTYEPITDRGILDKLWEAGIWVLNTVYAYGGSAPESVAAAVNAVKDHPSILMWCLGNEWNYNQLYFGQSTDKAAGQIRAASAAVKRHDQSRPVATVYGELPSKALLSSLPDVDIWGINVYRGIGFGDLFSAWAARSGLPMFIGEYGADAFDARIGRENQKAQAEATKVLTELIVAQSAVKPGGSCLGGIIFELADEWWKDSTGSPRRHDNAGIAPGGGPHPDMTFNEEWWGLVDIDRKPRLAYAAYAATPLPRGQATSGGAPEKTPAKAPAVAPPMSSQPACQTAQPGEACFDAVTWAMDHGIKHHRDWYIGLDESSTFEEFQALLHRGGHGKCSAPCPSCEEVPEKCLDAIRWAMKHGVKAHPEWYPGLSVTSSSEEFQAVLHKGGHGDCPEPCRG